MNNYLKSIRDFRKANLKSEISLKKNLNKRIKYCTKYREFDFGRVLFSDESSFQLSHNNKKVFRLKGAKIPSHKTGEVYLMTAKSLFPLLKAT